MVDTVILEIGLTPDEIPCTIRPDSYDKWSPSLNGIVTPPYCKLGGKGSIKSILNLSDKRLGVYAPKLAFCKRIVRGGFRYTLYVEFSAPKVFFGNNLEELTDDDLGALCSRLSEFLKVGGVNLSVEELKHCTVKSVHYGKNIILANGVLPDYAIQYLRKANLSLKCREYKASYSDGGMAVHNATNPRAFCVYDKKKELVNAKQTEKGRFEEDSWCQIPMLDDLHGVEILRLELRLGTKKAICAEFEAHQISLCELSFEALFKTEIARELLLAQIINTECRILPILENESDIVQFAGQVSFLNPRIHSSTIAWAVAIKALSDAGKSMREIRQLFRVSSQQWSELMVRMGNLSIPPPKVDSLSDVKMQLKEFNPVRLERIKDLTYNKRNYYD